MLNVKSGKSYILLKSGNARKYGHFRDFGGFHSQSRALYLSLLAEMEVKK